MGIAARFSSRLALFPGWARLACVLLLALTVAGGVALQAQSPDGSPPKHRPKSKGKGDLFLYKRISGEVAQGRNYYDSVVQAQRELGYPLNPPATIRLPTLALIIGKLTTPGARALMIGLLAATCFLWWQRLRRGGVPWLLAALALVPTAWWGGDFALRNGLWFSEIWLGLLVALSVALWQPGKWRASLAVGLFAATLREFAIAFLLAMAAFALLERRWREAAAWVAATGVAIGLLLLHWHVISTMVTPKDPHSPGWEAMLGYGFVLNATQRVTPLWLLPAWTAGIFVPLGLAGWAAWRNPAALRMAGVMAGYMLMTGLFARANNFYWAESFTTALFVGVVLLPFALLSTHRASSARLT